MADLHTRIKQNIRLKYEFDFEDNENNSSSVKRSSRSIAL